MARGRSRTHAIKAVQDAAFDPRLLAAQQRPAERALGWGVSPDNSGVLDDPSHAEDPAKVPEREFVGLQEGLLGRAGISPMEATALAILRIQKTCNI